MSRQEEYQNLTDVAVEIEEWIEEVRDHGKPIDSNNVHIMFVSLFDRFPEEVKKEADRRVVGVSVSKSDIEKAFNALWRYAREGVLIKQAKTDGGRDEFHRDGIIAGVEDAEYTRTLRWPEFFATQTGCHDPTVHKGTLNELLGIAYDVKNEKEQEK